ncbi:hypothetical protein HDU86_003715 [Geranomyces michiganensis]|nr:hypothetical protein HDU86_003715 [Geranomyces michiganensis]
MEVAAMLPAIPTASVPSPANPAKASSCRSPPASPTLPTATPNKRRKKLLAPPPPPPPPPPRLQAGPAPRAAAAPWPSALNTHFGIDSAHAPPPPAAETTTTAVCRLPAGISWRAQTGGGQAARRVLPPLLPSVVGKLVTDLDSLLPSVGKVVTDRDSLLPSVGKVVTDLDSLSRFLETLYGAATLQSMTCEPLFRKVTCPPRVRGTDLSPSADDNADAAAAAAAAGAPSGRPAPSSFDGYSAQLMQAWLDEWKAVRISAKKPSLSEAAKQPESDRGGPARLGHRRSRGRRRKREDSDSGESELERIQSDRDDDDYIANADGPGADSDGDAEEGGKPRGGRRYPQHVFLVGEPGLGKTSLVYSLAQHNGFDVLEMNAGQRRSGKDVATALGEAIDSQNIEQLSISGVAAGALRSRLQAASVCDSTRQTSTASSSASSSMSRVGTGGGAAAEAAAAPLEKRGKRSRKTGMSKEDKAAEAAAIKEARRKNFFVPASQKASSASSRAEQAESGTTPAAPEKTVAAGPPGTVHPPLSGNSDSVSGDEYVSPVEPIDPLPPPPPPNMTIPDMYVVEPPPPPPPPPPRPPLPPQPPLASEESKIDVTITAAASAAADESHPQTAAPMLRRRLILVEDADFLCEADKGFWSTIVHLVRKSKCPIVFTCNEHPLTVSNPAMPDSARAGLRTGARTVHMRAGEPAQLACFLHLTLLDGGTWPRAPAALAEIARDARGDVRRCLNRLTVDLRPSTGAATAELTFTARPAEDGSAGFVNRDGGEVGLDDKQCFREFAVADFAHVAAFEQPASPPPLASIKDNGWTTPRDVLRGLRELDLRCEWTAIADMIRNSAAARAAYEQNNGPEFPPFIFLQQPHADTAYTPQPALRPRPRASAAQNCIPAFLAHAIADTLSPPPQQKQQQPDRDQQQDVLTRPAEMEMLIAPRLRALFAPPATVIAPHDLARGPRACALDTLPQVAALCKADLVRMAAYWNTPKQAPGVAAPCKPVLPRNGNAGGLAVDDGGDGGDGGGGGGDDDDDDAPIVPAGTRRRLTRRAAAAAAANASSFVHPPRPRRWLEDEIPLVALLPFVQRFFHMTPAAPSALALPPAAAITILNLCHRDPPPETPPERINMDVT